MLTLKSYRKLKMSYNKKISMQKNTNIRKTNLYTAYNTKNQQNEKIDTKEAGQIVCLVYL